MKADDIKDNENLMTDVMGIIGTPIIQAFLTISQPAVNNIMQVVQRGHCDLVIKTALRYGNQQCFSLLTRDTQDRSPAETISIFQIKYF